MTSSYLWVAAVAAGPIILGIVIAVALMRRRRFSERERENRREAVDKLYHDEPGRD